MSKKLPESEKKKYKPLNLPVELVEELKYYRMAHIACTGQNITHEQQIREMMKNYVRVMRKQLPNFLPTVYTLSQQNGK